MDKEAEIEIEILIYKSAMSRSVKKDFQLIHNLWNEKCRGVSKWNNKCDSLEILAAVHLRTSIEKMRQKTFKRFSKLLIQGNEKWFRTADCGAR